MPSRVQYVLKIPLLLAKMANFSMLTIDLAKCLVSLFRKTRGLLKWDLFTGLLS